VKTADEMLDLAQRQQPALIIFDLNEASLRPLETIARLKADPDSAVIRTIGYYSHIQTELRRQAGEAGFDQVLAKSAFTQLLPTLLQGDP
jgi:CheY-like chemotaxis protein